MNTIHFSAKGAKNPLKGNEDFSYVIQDKFFAAADGYWGQGRFASHLAPNLLYRRLEERLVFEPLTLENAQSVLQECIDSANEELRRNTEQGYTTLAAVVVQDKTFYAFTLGDSVIFGYDGHIHLLTEPQSVLYDRSDVKKHENPFQKYCILDSGADRPSNFMGLPSPDIPGEGKPVIRQLHVGSIDSLHAFVLATDGLTSLVLPEEIEQACHEQQPERVMERLSAVWKNPEKMIYHLLVELYHPNTEHTVQQQVKEIIRQQGVNPDQDPLQVYDALRQNMSGFQAVAQFCLNYPYRGSVRKSRDDTEILYVELHPEKRPSVDALTTRIAGLEGKVIDLSEVLTGERGAVQRLTSELQSTRTNYEQRLAEANGLVTVQTARTVTAESRVAGLESALAAERGRADDAGKTLTALQRDYDLLQGQSRELSSQIQRLNTSLAEETACASQALRGYTQLEERLSRDNQVYDDSVSNLRQRLSEATSARDTAQSALDTIRKDYSKLQKQADTLQANERTYLDRIAQLETAHADCGPAQASLESLLKQVRSESEKLREDVRATEQDLHVLEKKCSALNITVSRLQTTEQGYKVRITELEKQLPLSTVLPFDVEPLKQKKRISFFSYVGRSAVVATGLTLFFCLGFCGLIYKGCSNNEYDKTLAQTQEEIINPPVYVIPEQRVEENVAPIPVSNNVPVALPVPAPEPVVVEPVMPVPTLVEVVQQSALTVCVTDKVGNLGFVNPDGVYRFLPDKNEPDTTKPVSCLREQYSFDTDPLVHLFYVDGKRSNFETGSFTLANITREVTINQVVIPSITQLTQCIPLVVTIEPTTDEQGAPIKRRKEKRKDCTQERNFVTVLRVIGMEFNPAVYVHNTDIIKNLQGGQQ